MSDQLPILNIPEPIVQGDTWPGLLFTLTEDGEPINLVNAEIKLQTFKNMRRTLNLSTSNAGISIVDAASGQFNLEEIQYLNLEPGQHIGDLQITLQDGRRTTYCKVLFNVTAEITT